MKRRPFALVLSIAVLLAIVAHGRLRAADEANVPVRLAGHMEMTLPANASPADLARGSVILASARALMTKYANVEDAERDGYAKFLPGLPLPHEHYTNRANALRANVGTFDPAVPTSLIYKRTGHGLAIEGVMYTAPNRFDAAQLDARVPLSLGTWHRHVDFCWAPAGTYGDARFGFSGTIRTQAACDAAGGRFTPRIFAWMVHVWPTETTPSKIWAVDADDMEMEHAGPVAIADQTTLPIPRSSLPSLAVDTGDVARGAAIFEGNCASCHGAGGANGPDAPRLQNSGLSAGQVSFMVHHPRAIDRASSMPDLGLSERDVADVAAYVATLSRDR
jgi:mono/diheme cytochrome c family protein